MHTPHDTLLHLGQQGAPSNDPILNRCEPGATPSPLPHV